jgi:LuxR family maltose regulon positive regulatory protein
LVPLDDQGKWFRYHHLFSDLLRSRPQRSVGLHLRVSMVLVAKVTE